MTLLQYEMLDFCHIFIPGSRPHVGGNLRLKSSRMLFQALKISHSLERNEAVCRCAFARVLLYILAVAGHAFHTEPFSSAPSESNVVTELVAELLDVQFFLKCLENGLH